MKFLVTILLFFSFYASGQYSASFTQLSPTASNDPLRPGTGLADYFNKTPVINYPNPAVNSHGTVKYFRMTADELSKGFSGFDAFMNQAISRRQEVGFRIYPIDDSYGGNTVGGGRMAYPIAWHNTMQGEANPDFLISATTPTWWPNYNSTTFQANWRALMVSLKNHINSTSNSGFLYKNVITSMDIGGIYIYGEGQPYVNSAGNSWSYPTGTTPTLASLKEIVQAQIDNFPDIPLIGNINFLNTNSLLPSGFGSFYLNASNAWGPLGMRWDHACDLGTFTFEYTNKSTVENGVNFKTEEGRRWMVAPVFGEPQQFNFAAAGQCDYYHVPTEAQTYHASWIENADNIENIGGGSGATVPTCTADLFRATASAMGYRFTILSLIMSDSLIKNGNWQNQMIISNIGNAPCYGDWTVNYEFWQGGVIKFSFPSTFNPKLFLPGTQTVIDNHIMPATVSGIYNIQLSISDPNGYKIRMPLQINTRQADGSYLLRSAIGVATQGSNPPPPPPPPPNQPPVVFAGSDQTDSLPKNVDTLQGIVSDPNGDALTLSWTQLSGPNTATMVSPTAILNRITGLIEGTYVFRLTANDGKGGITSDDVTVFVFNVTTPPPPPPPPPVYAPPTVVVFGGSGNGDTTIFAPSDSAYLRASITDTSLTAAHDTSIQSKQWFKLSGTGGVITSSTSLVTKVTGLIPIGNSPQTYQFYIVVTDKAGNIVNRNFQPVRITVIPLNNTPPPPPPIPDAPKVFTDLKSQ